MGTMYDSASGNIPADATELLVPTDGIYATVGQQERDRFPNATVHTYSAVGQVVAEFIDVEPGCVWPPEAAAALYDTWRYQGCEGFYCATSTRPAIEQALGARQIDPNSAEWIEADWTNRPHVLPGDVATQYEDVNNLYDISDTTPQLEEDMPLTQADATLVATEVINQLRGEEAGPGHELFDRLRQAILDETPAIAAAVVAAMKASGAT